MRATLIHNPNAAGTATLSSDTILELLTDIGFDTHYQPTTDCEDLCGALEDPGELVLVAGGDGTLREAALHLIGRSVPLALVPLGTANNIARTHGLLAPPEELIRGLATPRVQPFDVGVMHGSWGRRYFLEAFGVGVFADGLYRYNPKTAKDPLRAVSTALDILTHHQTGQVELHLDGEDISGDYLLVEVMNTPMVGPRLRLAPEADPSDGLFDLVTVEEDGRVGLSGYLSNLLTGHFDALPNVTVRRGSSLELRWDGVLHYDEELWPEPSIESDPPPEPTPPPTGKITVNLLPGALTLWLPNLETI